MKIKLHQTWAVHYTKEKPIHYHFRLYIIHQKLAALHVQSLLVEIISFIKVILLLSLERERERNFIVLLLFSVISHFVKSFDEQNI